MDRKDDMPVDNIHPTDEVIDIKIKEICEDGLLYLNRDLSLESLCHALGTNREYLRRYFASRGTNYYDYINSLRVEKIAKTIEQSGKVRVIDLVESSGFSSESTLRRAFLKYKGVNISDYQPPVKH